MVNGKQTWLAVLNGGSNPRLSLSSEFKSPQKVFKKDSKLGKQLQVALVIQVEKTLMDSIPLPQECAEYISLQCWGNIRQMRASKQEPQLERNEKSLLLQ